MRVLEEGARLADRYTLVRRLGTGGMSATWLARDRKAGTSVALKFLSSELADKAAYRKLLRAEWQLGSRLMHANIVRVFEYHDDVDQPFFSLQYIGGSDLAVVTGGTIAASADRFVGWDYDPVAQLIYLYLGASVVGSAALTAAQLIQMDGPVAYGSNRLRGGTDHYNGKIDETQLPTYLEHDHKAADHQE